MTSIMANENSMVLLTLNKSNSQSVSRTPSPSREIRGIRLFRAISRKLARRSNDNIDFTRDDNSRSSSSDSVESKKEGNSSRDSGFRSVSPNQMSSSSSETGSENHVRPRHHHSISAESVRKVFQNLNLNVRSRSCNNEKEVKRKTSKKTTPKRILRSPVSYTYIKGLSGLPTQRVPKSQLKMYMSPCGCSMQYMAGLNR